MFTVYQPNGFSHLENMRKLPVPQGLKSSLGMWVQLRGGRQYLSPNDNWYNLQQIYSTWTFKKMFKKLQEG